MWRKKKLVGVLWFILLGPGISLAQETEKYTLALEGRYWYPKLNSTVSADSFLNNPEAARRIAHFHPSETEPGQTFPRS